MLGAVLPGVLLLTGCVRTVEGTATASRDRNVPSSVAELGALVVSGVLGFQSGLPPYGTPIGLTVAALGGWLIHRERTARQAAPV